MKHHWKRISYKTVPKWAIKKIDSHPNSGSYNARVTVKGKTYLYRMKSRPGKYQGQRIRSYYRAKRFHKRKLERPTLFYKKKAAQAHAGSLGAGGKNELKYPKEIEVKEVRLKNGRRAWKVLVWVPSKPLLNVLFDWLSGN